ncbi:bifunctional 4-hydroxy-2-oxoglutarate aldolase/2-dehydro-3-deoxy-phosphogluconate aldolase [Microbacterium trichothecenolyticum]|uniref:2-dehydro-3-deoxy-phosphogluconate aldolase n=1 Tax=Microbacterium trichothecenolyticum TaxID=69370 RepID=A0ABU0TV57_MICTR|nr:bifunctional 4-hydroxy-2-oxoglutarate aldolase/2-dehydro-3-deoxy-phosphogluconate aldolase [Microbacterium trichothecenolyticum]MDQ1123548.1 2-dehydro-3-deoxyphosphogluconate aldolase/(4S)-4-hydroxy-2-oxoglutarate aldolase [Microbacterium trichothecenolyticum]
MSQTDVLHGSRIVPVVVLDDASFAPDLADALTAGGIPCAEITLRTPAALDAIRAIAGRSDFTVGAGTVTTAAQVDAAVDAGATYLVSPGFDDAVAERAAARGVTFIPGVATATEIQRAIAAGLDRLKLFPADAIGGPAAIRAFGGPFPQVRFLPSGGVSATNAAEYLSLGNVFAVSGSWMLPSAALAAKDAGTVRALAASASAAVLASAA